VVARHRIWVFAVSPSPLKGRGLMFVTWRRQPRLEGTSAAGESP
jgi:hypothetical protein